MNIRNIFFCRFGMVLLQLFIASFMTASISAAIPYKAEFTKFKKRTMLAEFKAQSMTVKLQNSPPATIAQLRRRADRDIVSMTAVLKSHGYYDGKIAYSIDINQSPTLVSFKTKLNERYLFRDLKIKYLKTHDTGFSLPILKLSLKKDAPAVASAVAFEEAQLLRRMKESGYPFAQLSESIIKIDTDSKRIDVLFVINAGQISTFGSTEVSGEESVKSSYLHRRIP